MKYLPGSFWILPGRVFLLRGLGHDVSLSSAALFFEMITQALSASLVAAVLIELTGFTSGWYREIAWLVLAGFLAPFSPGGIGVREGVLVLLLTPFVGGPQAVIVALLSRVISLAVELAFAAGAWLPLRWARSDG